MSKSEQTRAKIISKAATLFNMQGFNGTSISDIMHATELEKGGIYNHFSSKDEIALAAFDYSYTEQYERYTEIMKSLRGQTVEQLRAIIDVFLESYHNPAIAGGCVIMNTAIESDDTHPVLKARAAAAMDEWTGLIQRIIQKGIDKGLFRPEIDSNALAGFMVASLEGGLMMSKLYNDPLFVHRVAEHLHNHIDQNVLI